MGNWRYVLGKLCGSCVRGMPGLPDNAKNSEEPNTVEIQVPPVTAGWESTFDQLDERQHISFSDLQLHELLAQGRHREVYRGYWFNTEVAVICMKGGGKIREARLLQRQCKHPNLQMFYGWSQDDNGNEYIVMELAAHGSLDVLLQQQGHTLRTADKMVLCEQVCAAMRALAVEGVKHGNLAASSVLVHSTQPWIVKVAGFELAEPVDLDRSDSGQTAVFGGAPNTPSKC
ncbi:kinase-like domain-containing protein [Haematococcus lacustris]